MPTSYQLISVHQLLKHRQETAATGQIVVCVGASVVVVVVGAHHQFVQQIVYMVVLGQSVVAITVHGTRCGTLIVVEELPIVQAVRRAVAGVPSPTGVVVLVEMFINVQSYKMVVYAEKENATSRVL